MAGQGLSSSSGKNPLSFDRGIIKDIGLDAGFWEAKRGGGSYKFELDMKRKNDTRRVRSQNFGRKDTELCCTLLSPLLSYVLSLNIFPNKNCPGQHKNKG